MVTKSLNQIKTGEKFFCIKIPDSIKLELIRLGISEGNSLTCISKIPNGPVVIRKDLNEIAIGHSYAKLITIQDTK